MWYFKHEVTNKHTVWVKLFTNVDITLVLALFSILCIFLKYIFINALNSKT